jgi:sensitive to high expression protein 9
MTSDSPPPSLSSATGESTGAPFDSPGERVERKKNLSSYDLELVRSRIRDWTEQAGVTLRCRADGFTNHTKTRFSQLGAELSKATGYEEIEALKREVAEQGLFPSFYFFPFLLVRRTLIHLLYRGENQSDATSRKTS